MLPGYTTIHTVEAWRLDAARKITTGALYCGDMPVGIRTILTLFAAVTLLAARARQLGVPFDGTPGPLNAITDVAGLEVGHTTLIAGDGNQAVRTGVTALHPRGKRRCKPIDRRARPIHRG